VPKTTFSELVMEEKLRLLEAALKAEREMVAHLKKMVLIILPFDSRSLSHALYLALFSVGGCAASC
jgi:hypothetical protein